MKPLTFLKYAIFTIMALVSLYSYHHEARAASAPTKPSIMTTNAGDVAKADKVVNESFNFIMYFVYGGGIIALAISLFMCLPFVGQTQKGIAGAKGALSVLVLAILIQIIIGFVGSLSV